MDIVEQGESYPFTFTVSGDDTLTMTAKVIQYPGDTATIEKTLTNSNGEFGGTLTSAETSSMSVGQWFIHGNAVDSDEDIRAPIKIYISKGW